MDQSINDLERYFTREIALCAERQQTLCADGRADEATFQKIRSNIFDIFRTVLNAAKQHCNDDPAAIRDFFSLRLAQIPTAWEASRRAAELHGDAEKLAIERIKLDAIDEIRRTTAVLWEGEA